MSPIELKRRNHNIIKIFRGIGIDVSLKGDYLSPKIILEDGVVLSASIEGATVSFFNAEELVDSLDLSKKVFDIHKNALREILTNTSYALAYKIYFKGTPLTVSGYTKSKGNIHPVFSMNNPLIYSRESGLRKLELIHHSYDIVLQQHVISSSLKNMLADE